MYEIGFSTFLFVCVDHPTQQRSQTEEQVSFFSSRALYCLLVHFLLHGIESAAVVLYFELGPLKEKVFFYFIRLLREVMTVEVPVEARFVFFLLFVKWFEC